MSGGPDRGTSCGEASPKPGKKRLAVLGPESESKRLLVRQLEELFREGGADDFAVSCAEELHPEDFVILCGMDFGQDGDGAGYLEPWERLAAQTDCLDWIRRTAPRAVLLLSDAGVYGKLFGDWHPVREDELGYVCHTDAADQGAQCGRMLEHLCARMAREDRLAVTIARLPHCRPQERDWRSLAKAALPILLRGTPGEAYNLPGGDPGAERPSPGENSPLEPYRIVPDTGKLQSLGGDFAG